MYYSSQAAGHPSSVKSNSNLLGLQHWCLLFKYLFTLIMLHEATHIQHTLLYVYMCCLVQHYIQHTLLYVVYNADTRQHYNNNNKVCVYVLPRGAL